MTVDTTQFLLGKIDDPNKPAVLLADDRFDVAIWHARKLLKKGIQVLWAGNMEMLGRRCEGEVIGATRGRKGIRVGGMDAFGAAVVHMDFRDEGGKNAWDVITLLRGLGGGKKPVAMFSGVYDSMHSIARMGVEKITYALGAQWGGNLAGRSTWEGNDWLELEGWLKKKELTVDEVLRRDGLMEFYKDYLSPNFVEGSMRGKERF